MAQRQVRRWARAKLTTAWFNNLGGKRPGDAVWRGLVRSRSATEDGAKVAEVMWDVSKAFDRVRHGDLVRRAASLGYPLDILRISLRSYRWGRRFVDGVVVSREVVAGQGIGPGSAFAVCELAALMEESLRVINRVTSGWEFRCEISLHVDDLDGIVTARDGRAVAEGAVLFGRTAQQEFEKIGLPFDHKKGQIMANDLGLARTIARVLGKSAGAVVESGVRLGVGYGLGRRCVGAVREKRWHKGRVRVGRIRVWPGRWGAKPASCSIPGWCRPSPMGPSALAAVWGSSRV